MHLPPPLAFLLLALTAKPTLTSPIAANSPYDPTSLNPDFPNFDPNNLPNNFTRIPLLNLSYPAIDRSGNDTYGINCMGSAWGCIGASAANIMHVLKDYMSLLEKYPTFHYLAGQKIACKEHSVFPYLVGGYYCAFLQGNNVPGAGLSGATLLVKMQQMIDHGCKGCGSVPISDDNDPNKMGMLTVNFVRNSECVGLCLYGKNGYVTELSFLDDDEVPERRLGQGQGQGAVTTQPPSASSTSGGVVQPAFVGTKTRGGVSLLSAHYLAGHTIVPTVEGEFDGVQIVT